MKFSLLFFTLVGVLLTGCMHIGAQKASADRRALAEQALLKDARLVAAACQQFMFDQKKDKTVFSIDPKTGALSGDLIIYDQRITPGTKTSQGVLKLGGQFSIQNADAFGGVDVLFDDFGERIK